MIDLLFDDVINIILHNLKLSDIRNLLLVCSAFEDIVNWKNYFEFRMNPMFLESYKDICIDKDFMRLQGKYLININHGHEIWTWNKFHPKIVKIYDLIFKCRIDNAFLIVFHNMVITWNIRVNIKNSTIIYNNNGIPQPINKLFDEMCYLLINLAMIDDITLQILI